MVCLMTAIRHLGQDQKKKLYKSVGSIMNLNHWESASENNKIIVYV